MGFPPIHHHRAPPQAKLPKIRHLHSYRRSSWMTQHCLTAHRWRQCQEETAQPGRTPSSKVRAGQGRSPFQAVLNTTSASTSLPAGAAQQQGGHGEAVPRAGPSNGEVVPGAGLGTSLLPDSSVLNSMGHSSVAPGSEARSASRASAPPPSTATTWLRSHSAHQLSINVRNLAAQVSLSHDP